MLRNEGKRVGWLTGWLTGRLVGRVFREEARARRNELCCFVVNSRRDAYTVTQGVEISMAVSMTEIWHQVGEIVESAKRGRVTTGTKEFLSF